MHGGFQHQPLVLVENPGHFSVRVEHIPEQTGFIRADRHASRQLVVFHPVVTPGTLVRLMNRGIDKSGAVGTGLDAITTTDAVVVIHQYESFGGFECRPDGANLDTGRFLTVVAHLRYREGTLSSLANFLVKRFESFQAAVGGLYIDPFIGRDVPFHPGSEETGRHTVFPLAGPHAVTAPDTVIDVDYVSPFMFRASLYPTSGVMGSPCGRGGGTRTEYHQHSRRDGAFEEICQKLPARI